MDLRDNGSVDGDIIAPRVAIAEGAHFRGSVDMKRGAAAGAAAATATKAEVKGAEPPKPEPPKPAQPSQPPQPGVAPLANPGAQKVGV